MFEQLKAIESPLMKEYVSFKEKQPDFILFFQVGEFFELYADDAQTASEKLNVTLTKRTISNVDIPMCGFPNKKGREQANQLAKIGYKVAIVTQSKDESGTVTRAMAEIVTPSRITDEEYLEDDEQQFLMVCYQFKNEIGVSMTDMLSGEVITKTVNKYALFDMASQYRPKEIKVYLMQEWEPEFAQKVMNLGNVEMYKSPMFYDQMKIVAGEHKAEYFDGQNVSYSLVMAHYFMMQEIKHSSSLHVSLKPIRVLDDRNYMQLHKTAIESLELFENLQTKKKEKTLFSFLNQCATPKGSRTLKKWMQEPLVKPKEIQFRQSFVQFFTQKIDFAETLRNDMRAIGDVERILARFELLRYKDRDLVKLLESARGAKKVLSTVVEQSGSKFLSEYFEKKLKTLDGFLTSLETKVSDTDVVAKGYNDELDDVREILVNGLNMIEEYAQEEQTATGIKGLKVENNATGRYFEVTQSQFDKVPERFVLKKELDKKKRFVTEKLLQLESRYTDAAERHDELYRKTVKRIVLETLRDQEGVKDAIEWISFLDVALSFAVVSDRYRFKKPVLADGNEINIKNGKHPLLLAYNYQQTIANDCSIQSGGIQIVTGPNMGGKSTYLKMVALCLFLAQIGSNAPAAMTFCPADRLLVRMGASDSLLNNQSTFALEMEELSYILYHATENSLILMDELGRGTSTTDGVSIAEAVIKYIKANVKAKTICSTHYHELSDLESEIGGIENHHAESKQTDEGLTLTYRIVRGASERSFGIEVAKRVGLPNEIIEEAKRLQETKYQ